MEKVSFGYTFNVGTFEVCACGDGQVSIFFDRETDKEGDEMQCIILSIDELNEISDKANAHKMSYENQEFHQVEEGVDNE